MNKDNIKIAEQTSFISLLVNLMFALCKGIAGVFGNSFALVADAIESMTDVFSSLLVFLGIKYATRPADNNHPYGHGKVEPLVTFVIVGFLLFSSGIILYNAIDNIGTAHEKPKMYTIFVLLAVVISKECIYRFMHQKGQDTHSTSLNSEAWHHRSDAISSGMALIGIVIAIFGGEGYESADDYAAIITAGIIIFNTYLIFRPALGEIMDEHLHCDLEDDIRTLSKAHFPETETEKLFIRKYGMFYHIDMHLMVNPKMNVYDAHVLSHQVKDLLMKANPHICNILIHIEPL